MPELSHSRDLLRQHFRARRQQLNFEQQNMAAQDLLNQCLSDQSFIQAQTMAFYLANDGEINPSYLIEYCWKNNKTVLLPIIHPTKAGHLLFSQYHQNTQLEANQYGIPEPLYIEQNIVLLSSIDIIFSPLVSFDQHGNRLGMGGGYYDRTLAPLALGSYSTEVIGLAHDCQQSEQLPNQQWDFPLNKVITPKQIFAF